MKKIFIIIVSLVLLSSCKKIGNKNHDGHDHQEDHGSQHDDNSDDHDQGHDHDDGVLELSQDAVEINNIKTTKIEFRSLKKTIEVSAHIEKNQDAIVHFSPMVSGTITRVAKKLGETVELGDPLIEIKSVELGQARADVTSAKSKLVYLEKKFVGFDDLYNKGLLAKNTWAESRAGLDHARADLAAKKQRLSVFGANEGIGATAILKSPIAGTIIKQHATVGDLAKPDSMLYEIADLRKVWVIGHVYEKDVKHVEPNKKVQLSLLAYPGEVFDGQLNYVASTLDEENRTLLVRAELENNQGRLRPGLFGNLIIESSQSSDAKRLSVPSDAVVMVERKPTVFIEKSPGHYLPVLVQLFEKNPEWSKVGGDLKASQRVVSEGAFILKSMMLSSKLSHGHAH